MKKKFGYLESLPAFDNEGLVYAIVETPKGSKNKYKYDKLTGLFECGPTLRAGLRFPFDFGFIPSTKAEDGDPLDIMILMDAGAYPGSLVRVSLIGILEASQTKNGKTYRNDLDLTIH